MPTSRTVTLVANTVSEVDLGKRVRKIEVYSDGAAAVYFRTLPNDFIADSTNFPDPTVGGNDTWHLPAESSSRVFRTHGSYSSNTIVRLISSGTPAITITEVD